MYLQSCGNCCSPSSRMGVVQLYWVSRKLLYTWFIYLFVSFYTSEFYDFMWLYLKTYMHLCKIFTGMKNVMKNCCRCNKVHSFVPYTFSRSLMFFKTAEEKGVNMQALDLHFWTFSLFCCHVEHSHYYHEEIIPLQNRWKQPNVPVDLQPQHYITTRIILPIITPTLC